MASLQRPAALQRASFPCADGVRRRQPLDLDGQKRAVDCDDRCGLARALASWPFFSEQFVLTDAERDQCSTQCCSMSPPRPVIVTTTHLRRISAPALEAWRKTRSAMVMVMPPYHGRPSGSGGSCILPVYRTVSEAFSDPHHDPGCAGSPAPFYRRRCWRGWRASSRTSATSRSRRPQAPKLRELIALAARRSKARGTGEEAITLLADLDAGATGAMTAAAIPTASARSRMRISPPPRTGRRGYERWLR